MVSLVWRATLALFTTVVVFPCTAPQVHAALIFRDDFTTVNASCGDCESGPTGRKGSCITFNVTYCGGSGPSSGACYRSELLGTAGQPKNSGFGYGKEYWFGFSLRLPDGYTLGTENPQEEIHFQMHGEPNHALHEAWRNPIFGLSVAPGKTNAPMQWSVVARGDPRLNITADPHGGFKYQWENSTLIGAAVGGQWESFVYHTKYVYNDTGFVELWRNGVKVVDWTRMGTAFHDVSEYGGSPPYMKIGLYKWGWEVPRVYDVKDSQVTYAEIRVGDATSSYAEVDTAPKPSPGTDAPIFVKHTAVHANGLM